MLRKLTEFAEWTGTSKAYRDTYLRTPKSGYTGIPVISRTPTILPRVEGFPIGQHPHIIRLLKGIFNERPPLKKLVPEWDLCLVLGCLRKPPFEPLKDASLKHVT